MGFYEYNLVSTKNERDYGTLSYCIRLAAGYAGKNWRPGVSVTSDVTTLQALNRTYIKPNATSFLIYLRYAF